MHRPAPVVGGRLQLDAGHAPDKATVLRTKRRLIDVHTLDGIDGYIDGVCASDRINGLHGVHQEHALTFRDTFDVDFAGLDLKHSRRYRQFLFELLLDHREREQLRCLERLSGRDCTFG